MTSRMYAFVRGRQLEGTYPGSAKTGVWVVSDLRIRKGWGSPPEIAWPYDGDASHWPPEEPAGMDALAKEDRLFAYGRVRTLDEARWLLSQEHPFVCAFEIDSSWHSTTDGHVADPGQYPTAGMHTVRMLGYDDHRGLLKFVNSWGAEWGEGGYGYLPYDYWSRRLLEAWYVDLDRPSPPRDGRFQGISVRASAVMSLFERPLHIVEITDVERDDLIGWALTIEAEGRLEVEDMFVRPAYRGSGYGRELAREIDRLAARLDLPLVGWMPHVDWRGSLSRGQAGTLNRLGLSAHDSDVRWAAQLLRRG
jgi:GNAT superfamily N-acetyltransferase